MDEGSGKSCVTNGITAGSDNAFASLCGVAVIEGLGAGFGGGFLYLTAGKEVVHTSATDNGRGG